MLGHGAQYSAVSPEFLLRFCPSHLLTDVFLSSDRSSGQGGSPLVLQFSRTVSRGGGNLHRPRTIFLLLLAVWVGLCPGVPSPSGGVEGGVTRQISQMRSCNPVTAPTTSPPGGPTWICLGGVKGAAFGRMCWRQALVQ